MGLAVFVRDCSSGARRARRSRRARRASRICARCTPTGGAPSPRRRRRATTKMRKRARDTPSRRPTAASWPPTSSKASRWMRSGSRAVRRRPWTRSSAWLWRWDTASSSAKETMLRAISKTRTSAATWASRRATSSISRGGRAPACPRRTWRPARTTRSRRVGFPTPSASEARAWPLVPPARRPSCACTKHAPAWRCRRARTPPSSSP
mmetsp:Transcript_27550/g.89009  ORF Transcript_27550/g.89009 Transcript_27550/m.89009 type:complete len:208 (-) Transcript_27550:1588-2211(-)